MSNLMVDQYVYYWKYIHVFKIGVTKFCNLHNSSEVFEEKITINDQR